MINFNAVTRTRIMVYKTHVSYNNKNFYISSEYENKQPKRIYVHLKFNKNQNRFNTKEHLK